MPAFEADQPVAIGQPGQALGIAGEAAWQRGAGAIPQWAAAQIGQAQGLQLGVQHQPRGQPAADIGNGGELQVIGQVQAGQPAEAEHGIVDDQPAQGFQLAAGQRRQRQGPGRRQGGARRGNLRLRAAGREQRRRRQQQAAPVHAGKA